MQNVQTTDTSIINRLVNVAVLTATSKQFPVYWDDMEMSWEATDLTWNQATDITQVTNITV